MTAAELVGRQLNGYRVEAIIGSGGMATVYRAYTAQNEVVALKVLFLPAGFDADLRARFEREARTAAGLNHPAIVPVLDVGHSQGRPFMAMKLIEGRSLDKRLAQTGPLDESVAADIAWQIADALDYAHQRGVIHRDIKPANILLTPTGQALLTDFGIALALDAPALTQSGYIVGTPAYISPEQAAGHRPIDGRADLYALGVVLYEMVIGHVPFRGSTPQLLHAHAYEPPPAPATLTNVSRPIETVILRALAKEAGRRFQTGRDMAQALAKLGPQATTRLDHIPPPGPAQPLPSNPASQPPKISLTTPHLQQPAVPTENPFFYGGAVAPDLFYGRQELVRTIIHRLGGRSAQSVSVVGERRIGKSSLLTYIQANLNHYFSPQTVIIYLDLMKAYSHTRLGLMKALRRALTRVWRTPWRADEDGDLMAFDFALEEIQADGIRLLLFLDEVENLTQRAAEFNDVLEDWRACAQLGQMAILAASAQPLADLCAWGGLTSPFYNIFSQYRLGLLSETAWQALVRDHMPVSEEELAFIDKVAGGHPFLTQMAAGYLWDGRAKKAVDYDRLYQELGFQLQPHLRYLWRGLSAAEQTTLRQVANLETAADPQVLAALERRGITNHQGRPFSHLFGQMISGGRLET